MADQRAECAHFWQGKAKTTRRALAGLSGENEGMLDEKEMQQRIELKFEMGKVERKSLRYYQVPSFSECEEWKWSISTSSKN